MYNVGECCNLRAMDKALKHKTSKYSLFSHNVIDSEEIMKNCKHNHAKSALGTSKKNKSRMLSTTSQQEELIQSIWKDLNLSKSQMDNFQSRFKDKKRV